MSSYTDSLYSGLDFSKSKAMNNGMAYNEEGEEDVDGGDDSLKIPITSSSSSSSKELFVEIFPEEMSSISPGTLITVLKDESAPMSTWTDAAVLYAQCGKARDGLFVLQEACSMESVLRGDKNDRVRLLASTGIAHLSQMKGGGGIGSSGSTTKSSSGGSAVTSTTTAAEQALGDNLENKAMADDRFTQATRMDQLYPMTWVGKGMLNAFNGRLDQARYFFDTTLKHVGPVLPALLGLASVEFYEKNYHKALKLYGTAMQLFPSSKRYSASIRVGFGLCCYKLGQVDRARAAFQRAHEMDPHNVEAMTYVAVLSLNALGDCNFSSSATKQEEAYLQHQEEAIKLLSVAHLLDRNNATVQLRLADHYFWKWEFVSGVKVSISSSSPKVMVTTIPLHLEPGERIRIGTDFETVVSQPSSSVSAAAEEEAEQVGGRTSFTLRDAWPYESTDNLRLWRKDYDRVDDLAKAAYASTLVPELQAESLFHRARVLHTKGITEEAIKFYARATEIYPELTPARWGWAQCQIALGLYAEAMKNLIIVTTQNPQAMEAFAILGLLQIVMQLPSSTAHSTNTNTDAANTPESANSNSANDRKQALANLKKATELDPNNVEWVLLQALVYQTNKAEYSLALDRYQKAVEMMELQNSLTTSNEHAPAVIPPDIYTNIGVIQQELGQYDEALRMYEMALKGLGDATSDSFDKIEDNLVELVIIREESNKLFWTFVDSGLKVARPVLGATDKLLVTNEPESEIISTIQVGDHIRIGKKDSFTTEIVEITSQEATTMIRVKDFFTPPPASHDNEYLEVFIKRPTSLLRHPVAITIAFNLARLHEDAGRPVAAVELHKAILRKHPSYVNCYLRLACIACDNGLLDECSEWLKGAVKVAPSHPEVLTLVGNLHLSLSDWAPAQKLFDKLLSLRNPTVEAYSLLSLGNIYFSSLYSSPERYEKNLMHAADYYRKVLSKDKSNYFAANGIGTILAEKGDLFRAKEIFNRVREVCGDAIPDTLLNLGHIYLAQKKHPEALQMYNNYKSRSFSKGIASNKEHAAVLLYIAFAYFDWARQTEMFNNAKAAPADERYAKCIEHIELALKLQKDNHILKYNWCMAKLQAANCILQKLTRNIPRTAQEVADALQGLEDSLPVVQQLMNWKNSGKKVIISTATLAGFISQCQDNIEMTKKHLNEEVKREAELEERREIQRLEAQQLQLEREKELLARREAEEKARQEQEMKAKAKMEKVGNLLENWDREAKYREAAIEAKKSKKSPKNPQALNDDFIVDDDDDEGEENDQVEQGQTEKHLFGDSSSDEENEKNEKESDPHRQVVDDRRKGQEKLSTEKDLFGDSEEEDDEKDNAVEMAQKDLFGDSDEDDDDNEDVVQVAGTKRSSMSDKEEEEMPKPSKNKKMRMLHE